MRMVLTPRSASLRRDACSSRNFSAKFGLRNAHVCATSFGRLALGTWFGLAASTRASAVGV